MYLNFLSGESRGGFWNPSGSSDFLCIDHSSCCSDLNMDLSENTTDEEIYTTSYQLCIDHGRSVWKSDRQSIQGDMWLISFYLNGLIFQSLMLQIIYVTVTMILLLILILFFYKEEDLVFYLTGKETWTRQ